MLRPSTCTWFKNDGEQMTDEEWHSGWVRCIGMMLNGHTIGDIDESGTPVTDNTFLVLLNCHHEHIDFLVPSGSWSIVVDTNEPEQDPSPVAEGVTT